MIRAKLFALREVEAIGRPRAQRFREGSVSGKRPLLNVHIAQRSERIRNTNREGRLKTRRDVEKMVRADDDQQIWPQEANTPADLVHALDDTKRLGVSIGRTE